MFAIKCAHYINFSLSMSCRLPATTLLCAENLLRPPALLLPLRGELRHRPAEGSAQLPIRDNFNCLFVTGARKRSTCRLQAHRRNYWNFYTHTQRHIRRLAAPASRSRRLDPGRESGELPAALAPHAPHSPATARLALAGAHRRRGRTEVGRKRPHILAAMLAK